MPFFYSQYLGKDEKTKAGRQSSLSASQRAQAKPKPSVATRSNAGTARTQPQRRPSLADNGRPKSGRLVWHSNTGASGNRKKQANNFKPLKYKAGGKKVVHFSTIEVQPFHFDWSLANDVFYTRPELTAMGQSRFDDAATLRQQRHLDDRGEGHTMDDANLSTRSKSKDITTLLATALEDEDRDNSVSIRGIEHFVYPGLQQEMIRRKKEVQREVLGFVRSKRPDPQGWRLANHSRTFSQWARNVALEKGMKYCMNNAADDPENIISKDELDRFQRSVDELEDSSRSLRGSSSFSAGSRSFDVDERGLSVLQEISEGEVGKVKEEDLDDSRTSQQAAGDGSGEE